MLRILCAVIPVLVIVLQVIIDQPILWLLMILFAVLGLMFATVNFRFRRNTLSIVLLAANACVFIYCLILTITVWAN
jgi:ABC-type branched-subunit amino acid transport system permease subunit